MASSQVHNFESRIDGFDIARAFAIFTMIISNFKIPIVENAKIEGWLALSTKLIEGKGAALFVILAGIGLSLLGKKAGLSGDPLQQAKVRTLIFKRAAFLFIIGILWSPIWPADILHFYGFYLSIGAIFLFSPKKHLLWAAGLFMVVFTIMQLVLDYETGWNQKNLNYVDFWTFCGMIRHLFFNGFHPVFPWNK